MHVRKPSMLGKELPKGIRSKSGWYSHSTGNSVWSLQPAPSARLENLITDWVFSKVFRSILPHKWGKLTPCYYKYCSCLIRSSCLKVTIRSFRAKLKNIYKNRKTCNTQQGKIQCLVYDPNLPDMKKSGNYDIVRRKFNQSKMTQKYTEDRIHRQGH